MAVDSIKVEGNKLTIVATLDGETLSSSKKNYNLATTNGFTKAEGNANVKVSLNVISQMPASITCKP